jgi:hypothetical protein
MIEAVPSYRNGLWQILLAEGKTLNDPSNMNTLSVFCDQTIDREIGESRLLRRSNDHGNIVK